MRSRRSLSFPGWIDARFSQMLSRLVMNVFIVCTILNSVVNVEPIFTGGELGTAILVAFFLQDHHPGHPVPSCRPWELFPFRL